MNIKGFALLCFSAMAFYLSGQTHVQFNIHHKLAADQFEFNKTVDNNINTPFQLTRLEYYISEISLIHDGGQETPVTDLYILVNASAPTSIDLGSFDIANLEKIKFHIGVDPGHNNLDPTIYKADHPLAPKNPVMHWGWASGYNFIALEGLGGTNQDKVFQIHALGNDNYHEILLNTETSAVNDLITIDINGDYTRALEDLDASIGIIYHGTTKFAKDLIGNFKDMVFTSSTVPASTIEQGIKVSFDVFPNPSTHGLIKVTTQLLRPQDGLIIVTDHTGKKMTEQQMSSNVTEIGLKNVVPGTYLLSLWYNGKLTGTQRILIN